MNILIKILCLFKIVLFFSCCSIINEQSKEFDEKNTTENEVTTLVYGYLIRSFYSYTEGELENADHLWKKAKNIYDKYIKEMRYQQKPAMIRRFEDLAELTKLNLQRAYRENITDFFKKMNEKFNIEVNNLNH